MSLAGPESKVPWVGAGQAGATGRERRSRTDLLRDALLTGQESGLGGFWEAEEKGEAGTLKRTLLKSRD